MSSVPWLGAALALLSWLGAFLVWWGGMKRRTDQIEASHNKLEVRVDTIEDDVHNVRTAIAVHSAETATERRLRATPVHGVRALPFPEPPEEK